MLKSKHTVTSSSTNNNPNRPRSPQSKKPDPRAAKPSTLKMAPTIAERAARGEALHAPDLTRQEQGELLVWAREENMGYKEIKTKYGFEQTTDTMRGWHMALVRDRPPKVPTFTDEDVS